MPTLCQRQQWCDIDAAATPKTSCNMCATLSVGRQAAHWPASRHQGGPRALPHRTMGCHQNCSRIFRPEVPGMRDTGHLWGRTLVPLRWRPQVVHLMLLCCQCNHVGACCCSADDVLAECALSMTAAVLTLLQQPQLRSCHERTHLAAAYWRRSRLGADSSPCSDPNLSAR